MKNFNNANISKKYINSALAIGNFDGVHKGHQKVFREAKKSYIEAWSSSSPLSFLREYVAIAPDM